MSVPQQPGVYLLRASKTKIIYIGSTNNLSKRRAVHMYSIKNNLINIGCKPMIDAYFLGDYVSFEVIEICNNYLEREQYWLNFYKNDVTYKVINVFDADRNKSTIPKAFRTKMSKIREEQWKDPLYRSQQLENLKSTQFKAEDKNKIVHQFDKKGKYIKTFESAKTASILLNLNRISLSTAARGDYMYNFIYKDWIFVYDGVLNKLDELLETRPLRYKGLRAISSEALENCKSTMNVQRLIGEQVSNKPNTSVQQLSFNKLKIVDDIV